MPRISAASVKLEVRSRLFGKKFLVMFGEADQIAVARTQRRHFHGDDIEPEIQIFAEQAFGHALFQIAIGRSNDAQIGLSLIHISEPTRQAEISYAVFCL